MENKVEFLEDRTFLKSLPNKKIPENSIEGWFYKHFPGSIGLKRALLLLMVVLMFAASIVLFLLSRTTVFDEQTQVSFNSESYEII